MTVDSSRSGPDAGILTVTIDNPPVNALSADVRDALTEAFAQVAASDPAIRVVVLQGANKRFSAGGDIRELAEPSDPGRNRLLHKSFARLYSAVRNCPVPVIGAIEGYAMGGGLELALCCDLRYVTPDARLAASAVNMGLVESVHSLVAVVGRSQAAELLFTGQSIDGVEAARVGVATRCVTPAEFHHAVGEVALRIAGSAPMSVRAVKQLLDTEQIGPSEAARLARAMWLSLRTSQDHAEALAAFNAKRPPVFSGR